MLLETDSITSGGKLLLVESVQPNLLSTSFYFGLLPGWWLSSEPFRTGGPLISEIQWDKVLGENGFSGLDLVLKDAGDEDLHDISVMISTADTDDPPVKGIEAKQHVFIICESPKQMQQQLTLSLRKSLIERGFRSCTIIDYHDLRSANVNVQGSLCVVLVGLGKTNLSEINENEFNNIKDLLLTSSWLLWISGDEVENPALAMVTGLIRTVRWERDFDAPNLVLLSVENPRPESKALADKIGDYCKSYRRERNEEFLLRNNEFWAPRVRESARMTRYLDIKAGKLTPSLQALGANRALRLTTQSPGMLNKLVFEDDPDWHTPLADTDVEVKIESAGVNFKDTVIAMGQLPEISMGLEGAGEVTRVGSKVQHIAVGDRVVTFAKRGAGCFQTFFRVNENAVVKVPPQMTLDEAAAIPLVFTTVLYSLSRVARLSCGETILIHAAAGGVGQAAIQVAQLAGAEIFATVSTPEKRDWIVREYGIAEDHIFSSRDLSFAKGIKRMTQDRGVDVVLNSLSGEALHRSWDCIAPFGRFIELGKKDIVANGRLQMAPFLHNALYYAMDMGEIIELKPREAVALIEEAFSLFAQGKIHTARPLTIYSYADVEKAFRELQSGQGMGKIILKPHIGDIVRVS
jgi:NADPH:quinone reductase-like Zn-dependent oxidoreductase